MNTYEELFTPLDLLGTYAFATGAVLVAKERRLDLFGVAAVAYVVACGGGIIRDVCIGAVPPAGLSNWRYLVAVLAAVVVTLVAAPLLRRFKHSVQVVDAVGVAFFAVSGAQKASAFVHEALVAVLLGMMTAVGGGVIRDLLLNRVPVIMHREIYALAALVGAATEVVGERLAWPAAWRSWIAIAVCFGFRIAALRFHWNLPRFGADRS